MAALGILICKSLFDNQLSQPRTIVVIVWVSKALKIEVTPFSKEEIKNVVFWMRSYGALVPYGFSMLFYQRYYLVVKNDLISLLKKFYDGSLRQSVLILHGLL